LGQLIEENFTTDPTFVEDFLLTHRTFMTSLEVIEYLLQLMNERRLMDRVTRVLLLWVSWHLVPITPINLGKMRH
jgi:Rap guanine nucleotide exchange factor 2